MEINQSREKRAENQGGGSKFPKKVGLAEFKVLAFSPSREELNTLLSKQEGGTDTGEEITYVSTRNGNRSIRVAVWLEDVKTGFKVPVNFFVEDKASVAKNGKPQYINAVGRYTYAVSEEKLPEFFIKAKRYRQAKEGEQFLMEFLRNWLDIELNLEQGGDKNDILLNLEALFSGDVTELRKLASSKHAGTITCIATVRTKVDSDGTVNQYQNVYNKKFLPGNCIRFFRPQKLTGQELVKPNFVQKFIEETSGQYGPKDFFVLEEMRDYKENENPVSQTTPIINEEPEY